MNESALTVVSSDVTETAPVAVVETPKRGRGRPQVYAGAVRTYIIALIGKLGLTKTRRVLNNSGAVRNSYAKKFGVDAAELKATIPHKLNMSMLKLFQLGREGGVSLTRGRPVTKVAVVAAAVAEVATAPIAG